MKPFVKHLFHEPLFQFLLIGAALFLLSGLFGNSDQPQSGQTGQPSFKIIITPGQIAHLKAQFKRTWQRTPTAQELKGLIDNHVLDEISYREATALGLDRDDPTIRSRMRLKLETLNEDIAAATAATDQDLQAFLEQHPDSFRREPQVAFRQVYLNPDRRANVEADARALLAQLQAAGPETDLAGFGDSLMVATNDLQLSPVSDVVRLFGDQFGRQVVDLEPGRWQGPVKSGYGLHLVYVTEKEPARLPTLAEVRNQVEREWIFARKKEMQEAMYKKLMEKYTIIIEQTSEPRGKGLAVAATLPAKGAK
ncbi:MAG: peptidylprolyl isomerase [Desulfobacterales bacterium]